MKIGHIVSTILLFLAFAAPAAGDDLNKCVAFRAPEQKAIITAPACTLGVDSACKAIEKIEVRVRYFPGNSDSAIVTTIGRVTQPPFLKIWELKNIPPQLSVGIGVIIEVAFADGDAYGLRREGIFLAHQANEKPATVSLPYEYSGSTIFTSDTIRMRSPEPKITAFAQMYWNEKAITARVTVSDSAFDTTAADKLLEQMWVEILFDPAKKRRPYPTEDIMRFVLPLSGNPSKVVYQPLFRDGETYQLKQAATRSTLDCHIEKNSRSGFTMQFSIPTYLFGKSLPQEMGYNIIAKAPDGAGKIVTASLVNTDGYNNYSPYLWPDFTIAAKPYFKARWLLWLLSFLAGLFVSLSVHFVSLAVLKDRPRLLMVKHTEPEKRAFEKAKDVIDRHITRKDMTIAEIAAELNITPKQLATTIKKMTGLSFKNYAMYLRTEIVCERLRSSHSGEATIAESCGFRNVNDMERCFQRFHHLTPQNFRKTQQLTQGQ
jgi:AraC-like DNA-binding protein